MCIDWTVSVFFSQLTPRMVQHMSRSPHTQFLLQSRIRWIQLFQKCYQNSAFYKFEEPRRIHWMRRDSTANWPVNWSSFFPLAYVFQPKFTQHRSTTQAAFLMANDLALIKWAPNNPTIKRRIVCGILLEYAGDDPICGTSNNKWHGLVHDQATLRMEYGQWNK